MSKSQGTSFVLPTAFSRDGAQLLLMTSGDNRQDVAIVSTAGEHDVIPLIGTPATVERNAEVSPDGRWVAFEADESGQFEVYVRPFPNVSEAKRQLSRGGGTRPLWSRNGRELFYLAEPGRLMAVPIRVEPTFDYGSPTQVFVGPYLSPLVARTYDVSPDGERFLMIKNAEGTPTITVIVTQHWFDDLRQRVPTN